jgi:acid phosphatase family membrane protein YuiD
MQFGKIFDNYVLIAGLIAWGLAQTIKIPIDYIRTREWHWGLLFSAGGMPSSHTAMIVSTTLAIGLFFGFDNPLFALAVILSMIVSYDATGVRRQAGYHAQRINILINELFSGQPISEENLREVLGHSPGEVLWGFITGIVIAVTTWLIFG